MKLDVAVTRVGQVPDEWQYDALLDRQSLVLLLDVQSLLTVMHRGGAVVRVALVNVMSSISVEKVVMSWLRTSPSTWLRLLCR